MSILRDLQEEEQMHVKFEASPNLSFPHILSAFFATYIYLWKKSIEKGIDKDRLALFKKKKVNDTFHW